MGIAILRTVILVSILFFVGVLGVVFYAAYTAAEPRLQNAVIQENTNTALNAEQCATYIRPTGTLQACAVCGNGTCEPYESCAPSTIGSGGIQTADCGPLYCPGDCQ